MKALHWDGTTLKLNQTLPTPKSTGEMAVVRVRLAGICATDLQILRGYMKFRGVLGHEFVGTVSEGPAELLEKRVVGEINFGCGQCEFCSQGLSRHCPGRRVMGILGADGSFADYLAVPVKNLHRVPEEIADEEAVFTEPLAAAFEILEQVTLSPTDEIVVFGDGKLGLLCAQALHLTGARVTVVGKHEKKLGLLKGLGMDTILLSEWKPRQADVVVEATGSASALKVALDAVRPRGTLVLKSTLAGEHTLSFAPLVIHEITVVGSRCGLFAPALQALAQKKVTVTPLVEKVYPLEEGIQAVRHAARPGALKVLLQM